ncbi:MAG: hypothetical protein AABW99_00005 [archaeon]
MKMRFCPQCASLSLSQIGNGEIECTVCHYKGVAAEGSMDEMNALKKSFDRIKLKTVDFAPKKISGNELLKKENELGEKLKSMKGRKSDDFEIL